MNEEEIQLRVQQISEELERMQPDIDQEIQEHFGEDLGILAANEQGVWGNVQAVEEDRNAPNVPPEAQEQIANQFNNQRDNLQNQIVEFRQELEQNRIEFLVEQYMEDGNEEDRQAVLGIINADQNPQIDNEMEAVEDDQVGPEADQQPEEEPVLEENPPEAEQGDYFNPDDFDYSDINEDYDSLSNEFNDIAPEGFENPGHDQGIEP